MTIVIFLIVLAFLIFVHELGHFLSARACGIRVDAFKIGFGPRIFSWKRGETEYGLNLIPFGGYVKIFGENPDEENTHGPDSARSFVHKHRWKQALVLVAGVLFNFIFAGLIYMVVFATGVTAAPDSFEGYSAYFHDPRIMVSEVVPDSPAAKAGIKPGDVIPATSVQAVQHEIAGSGGAPLALSYERGGRLFTATVVPVTGIVGTSTYAIGIAMDDVVNLRLPFFSAIWVGTHYTWTMIQQTAVGLALFLGSLFHGTADLAAVSGPVGIAGIVGDAAHLGFTYLLMITALISINLGVINLIPFPALDGGRILFVAIEGGIRRRIPARFANTVNAIGFILLMLLMVVVTWRDIAKLIR